MDRIAVSKGYLRFFRSLTDVMIGILPAQLRIAADFVGFAVKFVLLPVLLLVFSGTIRDVTASTADLRGHRIAHGALTSGVVHLHG